KSYQSYMHVSSALSSRFKANKNQARQEKLYQDTLTFLLTLLIGNNTTPENYTLSLHDALPILAAMPIWSPTFWSCRDKSLPAISDRKSTRLNSSHVKISYAVFCLKIKKLPFTLF